MIHHDVKTYDINVVVRVESKTKKEALSNVEQMFNDYYKHYVETTQVVDVRVDPSYLSVDNLTKVSGGCQCKSCQDIARDGTP